MISHHAAIIYTLVMRTASDNEKNTAELGQIGSFVRQLPGLANCAAN